MSTDFYWGVRIAVYGIAHTAPTSTYGGLAECNLGGGLFSVCAYVLSVLIVSVLSVLCRVSDWCFSSLEV